MRARSDGDFVGDAILPARLMESHALTVRCAPQIYRFYLHLYIQYMYIFLCKSEEEEIQINSLLNS